jgi:hypothetical protein
MKKITLTLFLVAAFVPSIAQIERDIASSNNATEFNSAMFHAVCYAQGKDRQRHYKISFEQKGERRESNNT